MKIKLESNRHNFKDGDLWIEYDNIQEITLSDGLVTALCNWRICDKDNKTLFSPELSNSYTKCSLLPEAYSKWDKTEEHFGQLLISYITPLVGESFVANT